MKQNLIYLVLGLLFFFCICQYIMIDYQKFEYGRGYNICRRTLPYGVTPKGDPFSFNLEGRDARPLIGDQRDGSSKARPSTEIVGYGYNESIMIVMTHDYFNRIHYYVSKVANNYTADSLYHDVNLKSISEVDFKQYKSKCRWVYKDIDHGNILSAKGNNYLNGAIFILLLFVYVFSWRKNKAFRNQTFDAKQINHKISIKKRIAIDLPRVIILISFCVYVLAGNDLFNKGLKKIFEKSPALTYCKSVEYPWDSYFKDKDGEPVLGEGNHYYRSNIKGILGYNDTILVKGHHYYRSHDIKKILGYGYNDKVLIVEYRDSLNLMHYISSYQELPVKENGRPILDFKKISEYNFHCIKLSCLWIDPNANKENPDSGIITLIKFFALMMGSVSLLFWFILLGQKREKTYGILLIIMLMVYVSSCILCLSLWL